jgi:outer membrane protein OmpA-like peptidoglycan-associated protein
VRKLRIIFADVYILPCFWPCFGHSPTGQRLWFLALKNITQKEIFVHSLGLFRSSKLTAKAVVMALFAGLLGAGAAVISPSEPANATSCSSTATGYADGSGDGTSTATALRIATAAHLIRLSATSADWTGKFFIQTADIDLGGCEWTPIGTLATKFQGTYDGDGFSIIGLSSTTNTSGAVGLFGQVWSSTIRNLKVKGSITSNQMYAAGLIGVVVATNTVQTRVSNVRSEVDITYSGSGYAGGIVGDFLQGTLEYSAYSGAISNSNNRQVAGLMGYAGATINSSYSIATFTGTSTYKGGLGGWNNTVLTRGYSVPRGADGGITVSTASLTGNSFWDTTVGPASAGRNGAPISNAVGKTTAEMKSSTTYRSASWNIVDGWEPFSTTSSPAKIWGICSQVNDGYPFLLWEYTTDPCTVAPPPSNSDSGSSSGSVYVAPVVVPEVVPVVPSTIRQPTIRQATDDKPARLLGRSLAKDVLFIADSARLSPEAKKSLRQAVRLAMASDSKVAVTGFAAMTNRGRAYERSVAQKRALAVARYLRAQGFDDWIYFHGLSGRQGQAFEGDPRRVEIRILK